ncbi:MAG: dTDP-4-dehydrorhamnose 3,5-epimerase [Prevotella sp.]|nr:dTDP-4-dehydrorhamnose 3,5-epimerase [Prevotella sp.]MBQ9652031.1 dTDP-4-dehydrorhamnose 3,5-epimerase [Prevotella sp.]
MEFIKTNIKDVFIIEPRVFPDARGYFFESWKQEEFDKNIYPVQFVQDNESKSSKGVLRGLHYQRGEFSQAKLVRVVKGRVLDVAVDLRKSSPTFGKHVAVELSDENKRQLFIPRGFAHGFLVLSDEAIFTYKVDNVYAPQAEASIRYDDPTIGIDWGSLPKEEILTSPKDENGRDFKNADIFE